MESTEAAANEAGAIHTLKRSEEATRRDLNFIFQLTPL
jgi:hypothetical protein